MILLTQPEIKTEGTEDRCLINPTYNAIPMKPHATSTLDLRHIQSGFVSSFALCIIVRYAIDKNQTNNDNWHVRIVFLLRISCL